MDGKSTTRRCRARWGLLVIVLAAWGGMVAPSAQPLSEEAQVELLAEADEYFHSPERNNALAIVKYRRVLAQTDFNEAIRLDIHRHIGEMLLYGRGPDFKGRPQPEEAIRHYESMLDEFADHPEAVVEAHKCLGDAHRELDDWEQAEAHYRTVWELLQDVDPDEITPMGVYRRCKDSILRSLSGRFLPDERDRDTYFGRIEEAYGDDPALLEAVLEIAEHQWARRERSLQEMEERQRAIMEQMGDKAYELYGPHMPPREDP